MKKMLAILGPTSTGKTDLALKLAKKFNGELIACDSRQIYKGLDIGTGKLPGQKVTIKKGEGYWEMNGIKVWMYDVVAPGNQYSVYDYVKDVPIVIEEIAGRGKLPIIVGGTGLYLKALLEGLPNLDIPINKKLRDELQKSSLQELQKKLQEVSSKKWKEMNNSDRQNPRRLIRTIEIGKSIDNNATAVRLLSKIDRFQAEILKIGLTASRKDLYQRINERVVSRLNHGMIEEAKMLHKKGLSFRRMRQLGLEYKILADYLEGKISEKDQLIKILQGKIHNYARRQITWFKKEKNVFWVDITEKNYLEKIEKLVSQWYDKAIKRTYVAKN